MTLTRKTTCGYLPDISLISHKDGNKDDMKIKKQKMTAFL